MTKEHGCIQASEKWLKYRSEDFFKIFLIVKHCNSIPIYRISIVSTGVSSVMAASHVTTVVAASMFWKLRLYIQDDRPFTVFVLIFPIQ